MRQTCVLGVSLFLALAVTSEAALVSTTWEGDVDSNWSTPGNWSGGVVPDDGADTYNVTIPASSTVTVDGSFDIQSISVASGSTVTIPGIGSLRLNASSTNQGTITADDGQVIFDAPLTNTGLLSAINIGQIRIGPGQTVTNTGGTIAIDSSSQLVLDGGDVTGGTINGGGGVVVEGTAGLDSLTVDATVSVAQDNTLVLNGTITNNGTITLSDIDPLPASQALLVPNGTVILTGDGTLTFASFYQNQVDPGMGGTLTIGPQQTVSTPGGGTGRFAVSVTNEGTVEVIGGGVIVFDEDFTNESQMTVTEGILRIGPSVDVTNSGGTITVAPGATLEIAGGGVTGGTINGGGLVDVETTAGLDTLTVDANVVVQAAESLILTGTITNDGTISLSDDLAAVGDQALLVPNGDVVLSGDGTLAFASANQNQVDPSLGGTLTIGPQQTVNTPGGGWGRFAVVVTNQGTVEVIGGGTIIFDEDVTNENQMTVTDGVLRLGPGINVSNGDGTITIAPGETLLLAGGGVTGGTIDGGGFVAIEISGGLVTLTIDAIVQVAADQTLILTGTITNDGTINLVDDLAAVSDQALLVPSGDVLLTGAGTLTFATTNQNQVDPALGGTLTIGPEQTVNTSGGGTGRFAVAVTNEGTVEATDGGTVIFDADATNEGQMTATSGILRIGPSVTVTNSDGTITIEAAGTLQIAGGTVTGGTIDGGGLVDVETEATLDTLTVDANVVVQAAESLILTGTITNDGTISLIDDLALPADQARLIPFGDVVLTGDGTLSFGSANQNQIDPLLGGTLTIGSEQTLNTIGGGGWGRVDVPLTNLGTIESMDGGTIVFDENVTNENLMTVANASTFQIGPAAILTNEGTLTGDGTIVVNGQLTSDGTVQPGLLGIGTLTVTGNYTQTGGGTLFIQIGSGGSDLLAVSGTAALDGTLSVEFIGGFEPTPADTFTVLTGTTSGAFSNAANGATVTFGAWQALVTYTGTAVTLSAFAPAVVADIPALDPKGLALLAMLLALAAVVVRRG